jgi:hypothetical protein
MAKKRFYMTKRKYDDWKENKKERFGDNPIDWPPHVRQTMREIAIVEEVEVELVQASFPFSNTGVTNGKVGTNETYN